MRCTINNKRNALLNIVAICLTFGVGVNTVSAAGASVTAGLKFGLESTGCAWNFSITKATAPWVTMTGAGVPADPNTFFNITELFTFGGATSVYAGGIAELNSTMWVGSQIVTAINCPYAYKITGPTSLIATDENGGGNYSLNMIFESGVGVIALGTELVVVDSEHSPGQILLSVERGDSLPGIPSAKWIGSYTIEMYNK